MKHVTVFSAPSPLQSVITSVRGGTHWTGMESGPGFLGGRGGAAIIALSSRVLKGAAAAAVATKKPGA